MQRKVGRTLAIAGSAPAEALSCGEARSLRVHPPAAASRGDARQAARAASEAIPFHALPSAARHHAAPTTAIGVGALRSSSAVQIRFTPGKESK